ncbi:ABC transporter permease subunit [Actinocatenispora sera]|uniref:ABC transporter n=1 Tax=Actinocatenispora sera TaxID=390989 RepID=A0A810L1U1_9ACTN|nr:ABC transporter permease subunit [Actinocatenispora sera]BCJ29404.1 ABC transporter [Actinocatenispora sera]
MTGWWRLLRAEWTKARTVASTGALVAGTVLTTVALGGAVAAATHCPATGCTGDPVRTSLTGVQLGQIAVVVLAVLLVGTEYGTGTIQVTLAAAPRRGAVLAAKATVLSALVAVAGTVAVVLSLLLGQALLPGGPLPGSATVLRAAGGTVLYLVLVGLLALGVAVAVRHSAAAIGVVLGVLYLLPVVAGAVDDPDWQRHLVQVAPMSAGLAVQVTAGTADLPIGPWPGLAVLIGWAAAALLTGALLFRLRDA